MHHNVHMQENVHVGLGKRTRQVLDLLYRQGSLTATQLHEAIPELPSYSAARAVLRRLEKLGLATHYNEGTRYIYRATVPRDEARQSALRDLIDTFFSGSAKDAMAALVDLNQSPLDPEEARLLHQLIEKVEKGGSLNQKKRREGLR